MGKRKYLGKRIPAKKRMRFAASLSARAGQAVVARPSTVAAVIRQIGELKGVDTDISMSDILSTTNTNGNMVVLNLIQPGAGSYNRIGRKVTLSSVRVWGTIFHTTSQAATTGNYNGNILRLTLVWDHQPSGTLPVFNEIFGHTDQSGTEATDFQDPVRYDNMDRFQILRDIRIDMNPPMDNQAGGTQDTVACAQHFDELVKIPNLTSVFSGNTSPQTIADISTGALYFIARARANTALANEFEISNGFARLRYKDV